MSETHPTVSPATNPVDVPAYSFFDLSHHLRIIPGELAHLFAMVDYQLVANIYEAKMFLMPYRRQMFATSYSFRDLINAHMLSALLHRGDGELASRQGHLREALRRECGRDHFPWFSPLFENGVNSFIGIVETIETNRWGKSILSPILKQYAQRVEYNDSAEPKRLFPNSREQLEVNSPRLIAIDPAVRFGEPFLAGKGLPTGIIFERHQAGDSVKDLASDYSTPDDLIEEAIRYEARATYAVQPGLMPCKTAMASRGAR